jgi:hypothetical protein
MEIASRPCTVIYERRKQVPAFFFTGRCHSICDLYSVACHEGIAILASLISTKYHTMKKAVAILLSALTFATVTFAQQTRKDPPSLKKYIIALDKSGWEAWKNNDVKWFQDHTTDDFITISAEGISTKADVIKATPTECKVKSYTLADFGFKVLNENTVVLTYTALQDAVCGGNKVPAKVRAAVTYVKKETRWYEAVYMDTPMEQ